ncbi:MAG: hypothetical protein P0111_07570 [Nitrospira sp.]|nr:hypothetical protein [Nitrospira sp.]
MNRGLQLAIILVTVIALTAVVSHGITAWLRIETTPSGYWVLGQGEGRTSVFVAGSSLAGDGLSWGRIADELNLTVGGWGIAGSSPGEWEHFQDSVTGAKLIIIVVSPYDLNEYFLSDFRAEVVPFGQTLKDLRESNSEWSFWKRVLSMYPQNYLRTLFPSVGRSFGVIGGVREKFERYAKSFVPLESEAGPTLSFNETASTPEFKRAKISNWSPSMMARRLVGMRSASQGMQGFNGPKRLAFSRMLRQAQEQSSGVVVMLPVSPAYVKEFMTLEVTREFEQALVDAQHSFPNVQWIRLDQLNKLNSNEYFWDLVHMNPFGQQIATEEFLRQLVAVKSRQ